MQIQHSIVLPCLGSGILYVKWAFKKFLGDPGFSLERLIGFGRWYYTDMKKGGQHRSKTDRKEKFFAITFLCPKERKRDKNRQKFVQRPRAKVSANRALHEQALPFIRQMALSSMSGKETKMGNLLKKKRPCTLTCSTDINQVKNVIFVGNSP